MSYQSQIPAKVISKEITYLDGSKETVYFKEATGYDVDVYVAESQAEDMASKVSAKYKFMSKVICDKDGNLTYTQDTVLGIRAVAVPPLFQGAIEAAGLTDEKKD